MTDAVSFSGISFLLFFCFVLYAGTPGEMNTESDDGRNSKNNDLLPISKQEQLQTDEAGRKKCGKSMAQRPFSRHITPHENE